MPKQTYRVTKSRRSKYRKSKLILWTLLKITPALAALVFSGGYLYNTYLKDLINTEDFSKRFTNETAMEDTIDEDISTNIHIPNHIFIPPVELEIIANIPEKEEMEQVEEINRNLLDGGYEFKEVDFESLEEINDDVCAWISLDDTVIDLPIVQGEDNDYYLHHDIYGNKKKEGTLFVDSRNNALDNKEYDLNDFTIVYGHHMASGRMFATICKYKSQSYYDKHPFAVVYTPDGYAYQASFFAGVIIDGDDDSLVYKEDFQNEDEYNSFITSLKENSTFDSDVEVEYGDKVITLVTCSYETNNSRYVLYAKLDKQLIVEEELEKTKVLSY